MSHSAFLPRARHVVSRIPALAIAAIVVSACSSDTGPRDPAMTQLSFSGASADFVSAGNVASSAASDISMTIGGHTLVVQHVELTVDRAELERSGGAACMEREDNDHGDHFFDRNDDCRDVKIHPATVDLPLGGGVVTLNGDTIPAGTYRELEVSVSRIRLIGTFDGHAFDDTLAVRLRREIEFNPDLVVVDGTPVSITVNLPVARWFINNDGSLLDPVKLHTDAALQTTFRLRVLGLFRVFRDHDRDGHEDRD
jgi:hypothetical protein